MVLGGGASITQWCLLRGGWTGLECLRTDQLYRGRDGSVMVVPDWLIYMLSMCACAHACVYPRLQNVAMDESVRQGLTTSATLGNSFSVLTASCMRPTTTCVTFSLQGSASSSIRTRPLPMPLAFSSSAYASCSSCNDPSLVAFSTWK